MLCIHNLLTRKCRVVNRMSEEQQRIYGQQFRSLVRVTLFFVKWHDADVRELVGVIVSVKSNCDKLYREVR